MNPFGGPPHPFPGSNGDPEARNQGAHPRRGPRRRRPLRPPAWVRAPLLSTQRPSFSSSSTTTTSGRLDHQSACSLQPITRFFHPQDPTIPDGLLNSALMDNWFIREVMRLLQAAPVTEREQLFWGMYSKLAEFFNQVHMHSPGHRISLPRQYLLPQTEIAYDRYHLEYIESEELGCGGFGRVVRAKNKLDGNYYAIKMITEEMGESSLETCVEEVRTLAKLDHPNVVRYFSAWVQHEMWPQHTQWSPATLTELSGAASDEVSVESSSENGVSPHPLPVCDGVSSPSDDSVVFQDTEAAEAEAQPPPPGAPPVQPRHTQGHGHPQGSARPGGALLPSRPWLPPRPKAVLYIQMRLCGESLRKWMDDRSRSESPVVVESKCLRIFHQVVEALWYIHHKGYMHRDIKPANIFFTLEGGDIQLGDFGLARRIVHPPSAPPAAPHTSLLAPVAPQNYTINVGTPLYTAPEVKDGNYDHKSDMYSLGIILLELFMPFKTGSERCSVITNLKAGNLDPKFKLHWEHIACWIEKLTDEDPANRPSAKELLESRLFPQPLPPPSPAPITEETGAEALSRLTLSNIPRVVEPSTMPVKVIQSEFTSVNTLEINQIKTEKSVSNCSIREEFLSKDEQIAVLKKKNITLKEENDALKRKVAALERDLPCHKNDDAQQAAGN